MAKKDRDELKEYRRRLSMYKHYKVAEAIDTHPTYLCRVLNGSKPLAKKLKAKLDNFLQAI